jgi:hypothetical protein
MADSPPMAKREDQIRRKPSSTLFCEVGKFTSVTVSALAVFCMGGAISGWNSLIPLLLGEQVGGTCTWTQYLSSHLTSECSSQKNKLTRVYTYGTFVSNGVAILYGELIDRMGPKATVGLGLVVTWIAYAVLLFFTDR